MMRTHITHAMEMRAFFDCNNWGPDITDKNTGFKDENFFTSSDSAIDLAAIHEDSG